MSTTTKLAGAIATSIVLLSTSGPSGAAAPTPPPIEAFGKLPHIQNVEISPDGKRTAFVVGTDQGRFVMVDDGKAVMSQPLGGGKDARQGKVQRLEWADDDHLLVTVGDNEELLTGYRYELSYVAVIVPSKHSGFWVFEHKAGPLKSVFGHAGFARKNGHLYGYFPGQAEEYGRSTNHIDLYQVDLDTNETHAVAIGETLNSDWLVGPDGTILAFSDYDNKRQSWQLYAASPRELLAQDKNPYDSAAIEGQGRTPGAIVYDMPTEDGGIAFFERGLAKDAKPQRLFGDKLVATLVFDRITGLLEGVETAGDYPELTYFDPVKQARWTDAKKALGNLSARLVSNDDAFSHLIVFSEGEGDSGTYWQIDFSGSAGKAEPLGYAYPDIPPEAVGPRTVFDYKAQDSLKLHGILTLPPGREAKNLPVIVMPHGGPLSRDDLAFDWLSAAFASRGYAVVQPNFRGSSGYGHAFAQAGFGEWGKKMQTDVSDAMQALAAKGVVDPKRACTVGWSYGGYAALAGVTVQQGLYRCAVSVAGVSDLKAMLLEEAGRNEENSPEVRYWKDMMGARRLGETALRDVSPAKLADRADAPVLLIHAKDDTIVPIEQSLVMQRALKSAGKPVEFIQIDSGGHSMSREANRVATLKAAIAFVEKYDPPN